MPRGSGRPMKLLVLSLLLVGAAAAPLAAGEPAADPAAVSVVELAPAGGALADQLRREIVRARRRGLLPVVEVAAEWCPPCRALKRSLGDPLMVDAFRGVYLIRLDLDAWKGALESLALPSKQIPAFALVSTDGHGTGRVITGAAWGDDTPANMAPPLKKFFQEARASAARDGR